MAEPIKYLDYNGLSHFWSKVKTYIDDNSGSVSDIVWDNSSDMNNYTEQGVYFISGTHSNSGDNMPTNVASDCNVGAFLIVTVSTTDSSTGGKVIGQHLILSNRLTNETKEYTRTYSYTTGEPGSWSNWNEVSYVGRIVGNGGEIFNDYSGNNAYSQYSHAEGHGTTAQGEAAHAEGQSTYAEGINSHAEGLSANASGSASHAEGQDTRAGGTNSHAEGQDTISSGIASHAEGQDTQTYQTGEHAEGVYNKSYNSSSTDTRVIHSVGIGTGTSSRKNAHEIKFNGDHYVFGLGGFDGTNSSTANTLQKVIDEKAGKKVSGDTKGEIFNDYSGNNAHSQYSHAEGHGTTAQGAAAHAEGQSTYAEGINSHAEGLSAYASGSASHAEGRDTYAGGTNSHAEGMSANASGSASHAEGMNTAATGQAAHAEGQYTQTYQTGEHAEGTYNKSYNLTTASIRVIHSVGIGSSASNRKNAHEIKYNGDHYVYGIGGYDGTNYSSAKTLQEVINPSVSTVKTVDGITINSSSQSYSFTSSDANYDVIRMLVSNGGCAYLNIRNAFLNGFKSVIDSKGGYAKIKLMIKNNGTDYIALRLNGSKFSNGSDEMWGKTCTNVTSYNGVTYNVGTNIPDVGGSNGACYFGGYGIINIEGMWLDDNLYLITVLFDRLGI